MKKNDKVFCKTVGDLTKVGGDEVTPETEEPDEDDWDEDWEDLDFDTIGDEESTPEPVVEDEPLSVDEVDEPTETVTEIEDKDGFTVLLNEINNPTAESTDNEEAWWDEDEEWPED